MMSQLIILFSAFLVMPSFILSGTGLRAFSPDTSRARTQFLPASFPASYELFSSSFEQPEPPLIEGEFKSNFKQHKWNSNVSHITAGFIYVSPSNQKIRVDQAYSFSLSSSLFDYTNLSSDGLVSNMVYTLTPNVAAQPCIWIGYVVSAFPLWRNETLVESNAVFGGVVDDRDMGIVTSVRSQFIFVVTLLYFSFCNGGDSIYKIV
jgi:hypothetical protein